MKTSKNITNTDTKIVPKKERLSGQNLGAPAASDGRAFRGSVRCASSIPPLRSGTAAAATTIPNAGKLFSNSNAPCASEAA